MAPPLGFTLSMSGLCALAQASTTEANASLTSKWSMSPTLRPLRSRALAVAGIGPVSMRTGSTPASAKVWNRARGVRPSSAAFSADMISAADAPSVICELLPAVTLPSGTKAGFSLASVSMVVPGRMPSSRVTISPSSTLISPVSLSLILETTGMISLSKRPSAVALSASSWERTPKASRSSRLRSFSLAMISAETPWPTRPVWPG